MVWLLRAIISLSWNEIKPTQAEQLVVLLLIVRQVLWAHLTYTLNQRGREIVSLI